MISMASSSLRLRMASVRTASPPIFAPAFAMMASRADWVRRPSHTKRAKPATRPMGMEIRKEIFNRLDNRITAMAKPRPSRRLITRAPGLRPRSGQNPSLSERRRDGHEPYARKRSGDDGASEAGHLPAHDLPGHGLALPRAAWALPGAILPEHDGLHGAHLLGGGLPRGLLLDGGLLRRAGLHLGLLLLGLAGERRRRAAGDHLAGAVLQHLDPGGRLASALERHGHGFLLEQLLFQAGLQLQHLPVVLFVIVSAEMEESMDDERLHFPAAAHAQFAGHLLGHRKADDDVPKVRELSLPGLRGKAQHIGGLVLSTMFAVQFLHAAIIHIGDANPHRLGSQPIPQ